jgi:spermidine synthase
MELHFVLGVTRKTGYHMGQQIRELMDKAGAEKLLSGHVELDEAGVGAHRALPLGSALSKNDRLKSHRRHRHFMIPWVHLDIAMVPSGNGELRLMQRGAEFSIMAGSTLLMNSRTGGSETMLAELACERLHGRRNSRILIGGYGMGFTLRAALAGLGIDTQIIVAELVPAVMEWARGSMAALTADSLSDKRVKIHEGDVGGLIASERVGFDAILLDVDNGPDALSRPANNGLYDIHGLVAARKALRPNGLLLVWSAAPNREFANRLSRAGFAVEEIKARANKGRGVRHIIWVATR